MTDKLPIIQYESTHTRTDSECVSGTDELLHNGVTCPSCNGVGKIPKEQERQLIALIPVNDKRLKPRRTLLWVTVAVIISLIFCGTGMFFLIPRSVTLYSEDSVIWPYSVETSSGNPPIMTLSFVTDVNITNYNFFPITVVNASLSAINLVESKLVGSITNLTSWMLMPRASSTVFLNGSVIFEGKTMRDYCDVLPTIFMQFQTSVVTRYLGHDEQTSRQVFQRLNCKTPSVFN